MTGPTAPIAIEGGAEHASARIATTVVELDDPLLERLREACPDITVDRAERAEASRDWWPLAMAWALDGKVGALAGAVARPRSAAEVAAVLTVCDGAHVPVTTVAGRSGVTGAGIPLFGGVALDLTSMTGIVSVDDTSLTVDVRPGTFGGDLERTLRADHGLTLGHWPQSIE